LLSISTVEKILAAPVPGNKDIDNNKRQCQDGENPSHRNCYENLHLATFVNNQLKRVSLAAQPVLCCHLIMSRILGGSLSKEKARDVAVAVGGERRQGGSSEP
jgi:hypothetical protein